MSPSNQVVLASNDFETKTSTQILFLLNFINSNYGSPINLRNCASYLGLNPVYLCRKFKKEVGLPFQKYLSMIRIQKATLLLIEPHKSIKEVSFEVGFSRPEFFSKTFKRYLGSSPSEFRIQAFKKNFAIKGKNLN